MDNETPAKSLPHSRCPKWVSVVIVVLICWLVLITLYSVGNEEHAAVSRQAKQESECTPTDENEKSVLIVIAGFLAQRSPPDFIRELADKSVPQVRAMKEQAAAEWIVRNYDELKYDPASRSFRTKDEVTNKP